jgi:hypothetical protein
VMRVCTSDCWYVPLSHAVHGADPVTEKKPPGGHGEIRVGYKVQNARACEARNRADYAIMQKATRRDMDERLKRGGRDDG